MNIRTTVVAAAMLAAAAPAAAQQQPITYAGIPWGTSGTAVRSRFPTLGLTYAQVDSAGDLWFSRTPQDSVKARMAPADGLQGVVVVRLGSREASAAAFDQAKDSLQALYGQPEVRPDRAVRWTRGDTWVEASLSDSIEYAGAALVLEFAGPKWKAEAERRTDEEYPTLGARWKRVYVGEDERVAFDSETLREASPGVRDVWERTDYAEPHHSDANGFDFDQSVVHMQYSCTARWFKLLASSWYRDGEVLKSLTYPADIAARTAEVRPNTVAETMLRGVCAATLAH